MKKEIIKPLGENVLVKPMKSDVKTKSGIVLPDTANGDRPQEGKVMAIGDDKKIKVKKGDKPLRILLVGLSNEVIISKNYCFINICSVHSFD